MINFDKKDHKSIPFYAGYFFRIKSYYETGHEFNFNIPLLVTSFVAKRATEQMAKVRWLAFCLKSYQKIVVVN